MYRNVVGSTLLILAAIPSWTHAQAILNGSFESGLQFGAPGWTLGGSWPVAVSECNGMAPTDGTRMARLVSFVTPGGPNPWDPPGTVVPSSMAQTFTAVKGDRLLFDVAHPVPGWNGMISAYVTEGQHSGANLDLGLLLPGEWEHVSYVFESTGPHTLEFDCVAADWLMGMTMDMLVDNVRLAGAMQGSPIMPASSRPGSSGEWVFTEVPGVGRWFDPSPATGFRYQATGNSLFTQVGLPAGLGDADGLYTVATTDFGSVALAAGATYDFPTPVSQFTVTGISPAVDGSDALGFPTYLKFNTETASFTMTPMATVAGDVDRNGKVDIFDVALLQTKYGMTSGATWGDGDFDGNGTVDIFDVALMQVNYGYGVGDAMSPVPEPSTIVLALLGTLGIAVGLWRRRRRIRE